MPAKRGRSYHRGLDREAILSTALRLLDRGGPRALTMRALGDELDVEAPSLYVHFRNKDEIIDGVLDLILDAVELPSLELPWRDGLRQGFGAYRRTLLRHPEAVPLIVERARLSPAQLRLVERSIMLFEAGGLTIREAVDAHVTVIAYTLGFLVQEVGRSAEVPIELIAQSDVLSRTVRTLLERTPDERFDVGLDLLLANVGGRARRTAR